MAKNERYVIPVEDRKDFDLLVQRANRRIKASLKYIQKEDIKSESAQRALVSDYYNQSAWYTSKTVFSRSKTFANEKAYRSFIRHVEQWGGTSFDRSVTKVKEAYQKSIIRALTTTAIDNGNGVLTPSGRLPGGIAKQIKELSLEQLTNFFDHSDPTESIEYQGWASDMYLGVDSGEFVDITTAHLNALRTLFPAKPKKATARKRKRKKK